MLDRGPRNRCAVILLGTLLITNHAAASDSVGTPTTTPTATASSTPTPTPFYCCRYKNNSNKCVIPDPATTPQCDDDGTPVANAVCGATGGCVTITPTVKPTATGGLDYVLDHLSIEAGVVSLNPYKIVQATPQGGPTPGNTPGPWLLGNSTSTDVKGFVLLRYRDRRAWDCSNQTPKESTALAPQFPDYCPSVDPTRETRWTLWDGNLNPLNWHKPQIDLDLRVGTTFGGSSNSATTIAGTGDVTGTMIFGLPIAILYEDSTYVSINIPEFEFDGNTDRNFQDIHADYQIGAGLVLGVPNWYIGDSKRGFEGALRVAAADIEVPAIKPGPVPPGGMAIVETNSIGEPKFKHEWGTGLDFDAQLPVGGSYLVMGGAFFGGSNIDPKPWTIRIGYAIPISKLAALVGDVNSLIGTSNGSSSGASK